MKSPLIHIARLNACRTLWHKLHSKYSDQECYEAFVTAMNAQAEEWGMNNTKWINPSGLGEDGAYSQSTAKELAIVAMHVFALNGSEKHNTSGYELHIEKPYLIPGHQCKKKIIYSTTQIETIGDNYPIIGVKTGSGDGYQTLVMVCEIKGTMVSGAIMNAESDQGRFDAMDELMRIGADMLSGKSGTDLKKVMKARNACLYALAEDGTKKCIYTQAADEVSAPMSTTKVMTMVIAKRYIQDWESKEYITPFDARNDDSDILHEWDKLSIQDMMAAMMLNSSNVAANAIARIAGREILNNKRI